MKVTFSPDGPILISNVEVLENGVQRASGNVAFCRCGLSANKPFCDGTHTNGFKAEPIELTLEFLDMSDDER